MLLEEKDGNLIKPGFLTSPEIAILIGLYLIIEIKAFGFIRYLE